MRIAPSARQTVATSRSRQSTWRNGAGRDGTIAPELSKTSPTPPSPCWYFSTTLRKVRPKMIGIDRKQPYLRRTICMLIIMQKSA
jgi:hypothetical protein